MLTGQVRRGIGCTDTLNALFVSCAVTEKVANQSAGNAGNGRTLADLVNAFAIGMCIPTHKMQSLTNCVYRYRFRNQPMQKISFIQSRVSQIRDFHSSVQKDDQIIITLCFICFTQCPNSFWNWGCISDKTNHNSWETYRAKKSFFKEVLWW